MRLQLRPTHYNRGQVLNLSASKERCCMSSLLPKGSHWKEMNLYWQQGLTHSGFFLKSKILVHDCMCLYIHLYFHFYFTSINISSVSQSCCFHCFFNPFIVLFPKKKFSLTGGGQSLVSKHLCWELSALQIRSL